MWKHAYHMERVRPLTFVFEAWFHDAKIMKSAIVSEPRDLYFFIKCVEKCDRLFRISFLHLSRMKCRRGLANDITIKDSILTVIFHNYTTLGSLSWHFIVRFFYDKMTRGRLGSQIKTFPNFIVIDYLYDIFN